MKPAPSAGYSGTPLARKLGIASACKLLARRAPRHYAQLLAPLPQDVVFQTLPNDTTDLVHLFVDRRAALEAELAELRRLLRSTAVIWVSWPKKSSRVPTDITEDTIREVALPLGFVDVKVCAVDDVWSGLKLVVRKELR